MSKDSAKDKNHPAYAVGSRPPANLSAKAQRQLQHAHVSQKLMSLCEKASAAKVTRAEQPKGMTPKQASRATAKKK